MYRLLGEYEITIDTKGRFLLPSGFRKQLPDTEIHQFIINRGFEHNLVLYPLMVWDALSDKINKLNDFNPKVREFKRLFLNGATQLECDNAGRLLLPKPLQEFAKLDKEIIFSAQGNKVEIWDKAIYHNYLKEHAEGFSDLAAEVAGESFLNPFEGL